LLEAKLIDMMLIRSGEAHITVISPPEFSVLAAANVTIDDINKIAVDYEIQASNFEVICLGRAKVEDNTVYQIIVYSDDLVRIRTRIFQLYWNNGGNPALFDPKVGFEETLYIHLYAFL
jgi:hypothetical protein